MGDTVKMTRLERLYQERELVKKFCCIPFDLKEALILNYNKEINAIEVYGSSNNEREMKKLEG